MQIGKELSGALRITNLLAILAIVAIHYHTQPFEGEFSVNFVVQEVIHNIMGRSAVPVFAFMSGLMFFQGRVFSIDVFGEKLAKRIKTILLPTLFVTALAWLWSQFDWVVLNNNTMDWNVKQIFVSWLLYPPGSQFWFIRDLLILFCLTPFMFLLIVRYGYLLPVALLVSWGFDWQLFPIWESRYFLNNDTLTFFVLGAYVSLRGAENLVAKILVPNKYLLISLVILYIVMASARIYLEPNMSLWYPPVFHWYSLALQKTIILLGIYLLFVTAYMINKISYGAYLKALSGYSFFIFLVHDQPLKALLWEKLIESGVSLRWIFYVRLAIALSFLFALAYLLEKLFPRFFGWLSGGRNLKR